MIATTTDSSPMTVQELQERYGRLYRYIQADRLHTYPGSQARAQADAAMADVEALKRALKPLLVASTQKEQSECFPRKT